MDYYTCLGAIASSSLVLVLALLFYTEKWKQSKKGSTKIIQRKNLLKRRSEDGVNGSTDVIIIGAGVAGSALAYALAKDGWQVHIIERDLAELNRIAGEYLLPGGYLKLVELGLEDCIDGIDAQHSPGLVFYKDGKETPVPFPLKGYCPDVAGKGIHNGRFIQRLREKAASLPNVRLEQGTVTSLLEEKGTINGVQYKTNVGQELTACAPLTVVCDGCFSNLRRFLGKPQVEMPSTFVGLLLENCDLPYSNYLLYILTGKPVIFYRIGSNEVRCLVDVPSEQVPSVSNGDMANYLKTVIAPQIPTELLDAFISAIDKGNIRTMANRCMPVSSRPTPGAFLLGDALNMRHPVTGGGMTVALSDVIVLRDLLRPLRDLSDAASLCKYLQSFHTTRKPMASVINTLACALHTIFSSSDPLRRELGQACFGYLGLGGVFSSGFMALLAGLNPRPLSMVFHLLALLVYSVGRLVLPFPSPKRIWTAARLLLDASCMVLPAMNAEGIRQMFFPFTVPAYYGAPPAKLT